MIDEPDIIKQLREEERIGKLSGTNWNIKQKIFEFVGIKSNISLKKTSDLKIVGYDDSLKLAKKALNEMHKQ